MAKRVHGVVAVIILGLGLVACGGDDDDDGGGEALSEAEFVEQANAICTAATERVDAEAEEFFGDGDEPTTEQWAAFADEVLVPGFSEQIDDLRALNGPDDFEADVDAVLDDAQAVLDDFGEASGAELVALFQSGEDPFAEINARATELGLTACGDDGEGE